MQKFIIPLGGITLGSGLMTMLFGWDGVSSAPGVDQAEAVSTVGFSGVTDIALNGTGVLAFLLIIAGFSMAVWGNATAWKETKGY